MNLIYFLCGADIFDSLTWFSYALWNGQGEYIDSYVFRGDAHLWRATVESNESQVVMQNLDYLKRLQGVLKVVAINIGKGELKLDSVAGKVRIPSDKLADLANAVGVEGLEVA